MLPLPRRVKLPKGATVFAPGAPCPGFIELTGGSIRVSMVGMNGREVVLYRVRPGDVCLQTFSCLVENRAFRAEGIAETDLEGQLLLPEAFFQRLGADTAFRNHVLRSVAHRFGEYEDLVETLVLTGFDTRLARALLHLADDRGVVSATHDELAAETGSARAVVSRRLGVFADQGLVSQQRGHVTLLDAEGLRRIAA